MPPSMLLIDASKLEISMPPLGTHRRLRLLPGHGQAWGRRAHYSSISISHSLRPKLTTREALNRPILRGADKHLVAILRTTKMDCLAWICASHRSRATQVATPWKPPHLLFSMPNGSGRHIKALRRGDIPWGGFLQPPILIAQILDFAAIAMCNP